MYHRGLKKGSNNGSALCVRIEGFSIVYSRPLKDLFIIFYKFSFKNSIVFIFVDPKYSLIRARMFMDSIYVKQYYTKVERYDWVDVADHYKGFESIFHRNRRRVMLELLSRYHKGFPVLDLGCGTGLILRELPPGSIGLDINPYAAGMAKRYAPNAELIIGDVEKMPFRDGILSTIICTEVLEHLPNHKEALDEISRVLVSKGRLIGSVPRSTLFWIFRFLSSTCPRTEPFHNQFTVEQVRKLFTGYKILMVKKSFLLNVIFVTEKVRTLTK